MRNTKKIFRKFVYSLLNGSVSLNVYDEKKHVGDADTAFVLLSTQQESESEYETDCSTVNESILDIEVIVKTGSEVTKDIQDDAEQEILDQLSPWMQSGASYEGLAIQRFRRISSITRNLSISPTESIMQTVLRVGATITEQS